MVVGITFHCTLTMNSFGCGYSLSCVALYFNSTIDLSRAMFVICILYVNSTSYTIAIDCQWISLLRSFRHIFWALWRCYTKWTICKWSWWFESLALGSHAEPLIVEGSCQLLMWDATQWNSFKILYRSNSLNVALNFSWYKMK